MIANETQLDQTKHAIATEQASHRSTQENDQLRTEFSFHHKKADRRANRPFLNWMKEKGAGRNATDQFVAKHGLHRDKAGVDIPPVLTKRVDSNTRAHKYDESGRGEGRHNHQLARAASDQREARNSQLDGGEARSVSEQILWNEMQASLDQRTHELRQQAQAVRAEMSRPTDSSEVALRGHRRDKVASERKISELRRQIDDYLLDKDRPEDTRQYFLSATDKTRSRLIDQAVAPLKRQLGVAQNNLEYATECMNIQADIIQQYRQTEAYQFLRQRLEEIAAEIKQIEDEEFDMYQQAVDEYHRTGQLSEDSNWHQYAVSETGDEQPQPDRPQFSEPDQETEFYAQNRRKMEKLAGYRRRTPTF